MARLIHRKDLADPLRAEHIVVCVVDRGVQRCLFRVFWHPSQEWLFVDFPYFTEKNGLLAELTIPAGQLQADAKLSEIGYTATHSVKYSHHGTGTAHFSQHGHDTGGVRSRSVTLDQADGHIFTVLARGLSSFAEAKDKYKRAPNKKNAAIVWSTIETGSHWLKFKADWMPIAGPLGVDAPGSESIRAGHGFDIRTEGRVVSRRAFVAPPPGWPMGDRTLMITMEEPNLVTDEDGDARLVFLGAFDHSSTVNDLAQSTTALAFLYPPANFEELRALLPTTDERATP